MNRNDQALNIGTLPKKKKKKKKSRAEHAHSFNSRMATFDSDRCIQKKKKIDVSEIIATHVHLQQALWNGGRCRNLDGNEQGGEEAKEESDGQSSLKGSSFDLTASGHYWAHPENQLPVCPLQCQYTARFSGETQRLFGRAAGLTGAGSREDQCENRVGTNSNVVSDLFIQRLQ